MKRGMNELWLSNKSETNNENEQANIIPLLLAFQLFPAMHELICLLFPCGNKKTNYKSCRQERKVGE